MLVDNRLWESIEIKYHMHLRLLFDLLLWFLTNFIVRENRQIRKEICSTIFHAILYITVI